jgi:DNA-binding CsgD family transcriptional regulator
MFSFDDELIVRSWNRAAEELIGISERDAVGRRCWEILGGAEEDGSLVCHRDCPYARLARDGWPVRSHDMLVKTRYGKRRITLATIACREPHFFVHLLRPAREPAVPPRTKVGARLTPRQLQVLRLLDAGLAAKEISSRLGLEVATVRNHIRAVLRGLDAHSQLDALARARREGLLRS